MTGLNALVEAFARDERAQETTRERVTSTVGINNFRICQGVDGVNLGLVLLVRCDDNCALRAVRDDDRTRAGGVCLRLRRERLRNRRQVLVRETRRGRPRLSFTLVADDDVAVRDDLLQLHAEELGNEGCRKVEREDLGSMNQPLVYWTHA